MIETDAGKERTESGYEQEPTFTFRNTKRLIQMVQARPCLWDRLSPRYKDRLARDRAWADIFHELDPAYGAASATLKHEIGYYTVTKRPVQVVQRPGLWDRLSPRYKDRLARDRAWADIFHELDPAYGAASATLKHEIGYYTVTKRPVQVVQRPGLWDRLSPRYKDRLARDRAWADIFHELDPAYGAASATLKHEIGYYTVTKRPVQVVQRPGLWDRLSPRYKDRLARDRAWADIFHELDPAYGAASATLKHEIGYYTVTKRPVQVVQRPGLWDRLSPRYKDRLARDRAWADIFHELDPAYGAASATLKHEIGYYTVTKRPVQVVQRPGLWDRLSPRYKDRLARDRAWADIFHELDPAYGAASATLKHEIGYYTVTKRSVQVVQRPGLWDRLSPRYKDRLARDRAWADIFHELDPAYGAASATLKHEIGYYTVTKRPVQVVQRPGLWDRLSPRYKDRLARDRAWADIFHELDPAYGAASATLKHEIGYYTVTKRPVQVVQRPGLWDRLSPRYKDRLARDRAWADIFHELDPAYGAASATLKHEIGYYTVTKRPVQVVQRPGLWDRLSPRYKDRLARDRAWADIFHELDPAYGAASATLKHEIGYYTVTKRPVQVVQRPGLWDRLSPRYKDRLARDRAWADIFHELDPAYGAASATLKHEIGYYTVTKRSVQVVQRPGLWDRLSPRYKDRLARDRAWADIFHELDPAYGAASATLKHEIGYYTVTKRPVQVVQRPGLWDRLSPRYKDRLARDRAWADIFHELDPAYGAASATLKHEIGLCITKKWYNVRDSYVKSMKPGYHGSRRNRPYIHSDLLRFLDDRYFEKIKRRCRSTQNDADHDEIEEVETEPWDHEVFVSIDESEEANPNKRLKLEYSEDSLKEDNIKVKDDEDIVAVLSNLIQKEEDEDRAFFKSITPSVKKLSEDSKFEFRIQVMKLIKTLRAKDKSRVDLKTERISNNDSETE